ncbi:MAG TPA: DUF1054 domain-containing protein [Pantanalinema sp.]
MKAPIAPLPPRLAGFSAEDFDVFSIPDFTARMEALKARVRPKLEALGAALAPELGAMLGEPVYPHVAKHARRTVNPPDDTWVAWSTQPRGYKAHPHFQLGLWGTHVFAQFALIYESPLKAPFAELALADLAWVREAVPGAMRWSHDHMRPFGDRHGAMDDAALAAYFERVARVSKAEALCGIDLMRDEVQAMDGAALAEAAMETFRSTLGLYRLAKSRGSA